MNFETSETNRDTSKTHRDTPKTDRHMAKKNRCRIGAYLEDESDSIEEEPRYSEDKSEHIKVKVGLESVDVDRSFPDSKSNNRLGVVMWKQPNHIQGL